MILRHTVFIFLILCLHACGFHLRGSDLEELEALQNSSFYVRSNGANQLANEVRIKLENVDIRPVKTAAEAEYIITLSKESFNRKVLSVSPDTGKVEEYAITYRAAMTVQGANGETLANLEPVTAARDITVDEATVLGKFTEEGVLHKDIAKQAAGTVLRRLRILIR
jgi:LPS-assembly lipoprotein